MKKVFLVAALGMFALGTATATYTGGKEKGKKAKSECTKEGEKKACCASKSSCKKPAEAPKAQ